MGTGESLHLPSDSRRHEIDALRVLAVLLLFVFHGAMAFNAYDTWHIQDLDLSVGLARMNRFIHVWHMPLFFLLAGMSAWYALGSRTARQFSAERVRRLFVPLVFGMLVIIPPQVYIERISTWVPTRQSPIDFSGSFFSWYPNTFTCCYADANLSWHHLWFLMYLFVYSLVAVHWFKRWRTREEPLRLTAFGARGWNILLPAAYFALAEAALRGIFGNDQNLVADWANHFNYAAVFLLGFLLVSDRRLDAAVERVWPTALAVGGAVAVVLATADVGDFWDPLRGVGEWLILVGLVGAGRTFLNRPIRWVQSLSALTLPMYIWHQTVIVVMAYWVTRWTVGIPVKYPVLVLGSFVITWMLSKAVSLTPVTRVAFGLKARG